VEVLPGDIAVLQYTGAPRARPRGRC
jgi:hypothetical protein